VSGGDGALASMVNRKLPEAVNHLREKMASDTKLTADLMRFNTQFSRMISITPPTAPALRASLGSPDGRAYLLIAAALKI